MKYTYSCFLLALVFTLSLSGAPHNWKWDTGLNKAIHNHDIDAVKDLFKKGIASANDTVGSQQQRSSIFTPIFNDAVYEYAHILQFEGHGIRKNLFQKELRNAKEIITFLMEQGAPLHDKNSHGNTALHEALLPDDYTGSGIREELIPVIELLLKTGAKSTIANNKGLTPYAIVMGKIDYIQNKTYSPYVEGSARDKEIDTKIINLLYEIQDLFKFYSTQKIHTLGKEKQSTDTRFTFK